MKTKQLLEKHDEYKGLGLSEDALYKWVEKHKADIEIKKMAENLDRMHREVFKDEFL